MILILSPSANFCNKVLTSDKNKSSKFVACNQIYDIFQRQIKLLNRFLFVAEKKFVAGIQFCRSATSFGNDKSFYETPPPPPPGPSCFSFVQAYHANEKSNTHIFFP